jgi:RecB family endonuclease NucS
VANERDFEDVLVRYPEIIEEGLRLIGRQVVVCQRRIDLLFEDRFKQKLVVELKWGPIKDEHVGQIMYYQGALLSGREPVRTMLVGTRVPPAIQRSLDFNGLAFKEIRVSTLIEFLKAKGETDVVRTFEADLPLADAPLKSNVPSRLVKRTAAQPATDSPKILTPFLPTTCPSVR